MSDNAPRKLEITLEGPSEDEGFVHAQDFVEFLGHALGVLRKLERDQTGASTTTRASTTFKIVELEIGSAAVAVEVQGYGGVDVGLMLGKFAEAVAAYRDHSLQRSRLDRAVVEEVSEMMAPIARGRVARARIAVDDVEVEIHAAAVPERFELAAPVEAHVVGTVSGYVDAINVHKEPVFYLYPTIGPRVACRFDRTYLDDARQALRHYCTIQGLITYPESSPYPARIDVERIQVNPPVDQLPTLRSLWGAAPELTGGLDSVAYIRRVRDAWE